MTTKVIIHNTGPDKVFVEIINWPASGKPSEGVLLDVGQETEQCVYDTRTLAIREIK